MNSGKSFPLKQVPASFAETNQSRHYNSDEERARAQRSKKFTDSMNGLGKKMIKDPQWSTTLLESAKNGNAVLLLQMVTALKEVMTVGNESMLGFDYSQLDICTLFRKETFMAGNWVAEQWLVCLVLCLDHCSRRFPESREFSSQCNWLLKQGSSKETLTKLINVAVLISGGQLLKTPRLSLEQSFQVNPSKWDHDQLYLLLCNLDFVNNPDYQEFTLQRFRRILHPLSWKMVAPFVYNGICTLTLMAKKKVASSSYINPHGDLKWMFFGRTELKCHDIFSELREFAKISPQELKMADNIKSLESMARKGGKVLLRAMDHVLGKKSNDPYIFSNAIIKMDVPNEHEVAGQALMDKNIDDVRYDPNIRNIFAYEAGHPYSRLRMRDRDSESDGNSFPLSNSNKSDHSEESKQSGRKIIVGQKRAYHMRSRRPPNILDDDDSLSQQSMTIKKIKKEESDQDIYPSSEDALLSDNGTRRLTRSIDKALQNQSDPQANRNVKERKKPDNKSQQKPQPQSGSNMNQKRGA